MVKQHIISVLLIVIFIFFSCQKESENKYIAKIGDKYISANEFKITYEFNPYLSGIREPDSAKKVLLNTMIAEKLIALNAEKELKGKNKKIIALRNEYHREALIEAFWNKVIAPKIRVNEAELKEAYLRSKIKKIVRYLLFTDSLEAQKASNLIRNGGNFESVARTRGFSPDLIPKDTISYSGALPEIEKQVFKMKPGEVSPPIKEGFYYFILKVTGEKKNIFSSQSDYEQQRNSLYKLIKRRKMEEEFQNYLAQNVPLPPYKLDKEKFKSLVRLLERLIFEKIKSKQEDHLPLDLYSSFTDNNENFLKEKMVEFYDGTTWTAKDLLERIAVAPYPLRFGNKKLFMKSLLLSARHVLDDEVVIREAQKRGLNNSVFVKEQTRIWNDYLYYKKGLAQILRGKDLRDIQTIYDYLNRIKSDYSFYVNYALLDTLKLKKTDMAVLKQHFPGRIAVPVYPVLKGLNLVEYSGKTGR